LQSFLKVIFDLICKSLGIGVLVLGGGWWIDNKEGSRGSKYPSPE